MTKPAFEIKLGVAGYYTFHKGKVDAEGNPIPGTYKKVAEFKNLITNQGMNYLYDTVGIGTISTKDMFTFCFVGTGNTTPAFTDTTLVTPLASSQSVQTSSTVYVTDSGEHYWRHVRTIRFNAGTATGNIAEVGMGRRIDLLSTRALILDGGGSPTTITVLADEYLDVTYEFRNYIDVSDHGIVATISGVAYDVIYRPADIAVAPDIYYPIKGNGVGSLGFFRIRETDVLGAITSAPTGSGAIDLNPVAAAYVTDSWYADITATYGLPTGNFTTGVGSLEIATPQAKFQFNFDPKIPKDNTKVLTLTVRISWSRH